jgi:hypothetical protein
VFGILSVTNNIFVCLVSSNELVANLKFSFFNHIFAGVVNANPDKNV